MQINYFATVGFPLLVRCCGHLRDLAERHSILSFELLFGYNIYGKHRSGRIGGGVLIAVKNDIQSNRRFDLERDQIEIVAVELLKDSYKPVILYIFYHPDPGPDDLNLLNYSLQPKSRNGLHWSQWKDLFLATVYECVPMNVISDTNCPPWIDREVKLALRRKYRALRKYRENKTVERKLRLRSLSNEIKKLVRQKHRDYLLKIEGSLKDNP